MFVYLRFTSGLDVFALQPSKSNTSPQSTSDFPTDGPLNQQVLLFLIKHPPYYLVVLVGNGTFLHRDVFRIPGRGPEALSEPHLFQLDLRPPWAGIRLAGYSPLQRNNEKSTT